MWLCKWPQDMTGKIEFWRRKQKVSSQSRIFLAQKEAIYLTLEMSGSSADGEPWNCLFCGWLLVFTWDQRTPACLRVYPSLSVDPDDEVARILPMRKASVRDWRWCWRIRPERASPQQMPASVCWEVEVRYLVPRGHKLGWLNKVSSLRSHSPCLQNQKQQGWFTWRFVVFFLTFLKVC